MIKKSVFAIAMVGCFAVASLFSVNNAEAKKIGDVETITCYSASSGLNEGAWFRDCKRVQNICPKVDGIHSGPSGVCGK